MGEIMIIPTVIEKEKNGEKVYDLYSRLLKDRIIFLSGEIDDVSANIIVGELLFLNSQSKDDIFLYINSPGGSVTAGMAIYDTINFIDADVSTICVGMCASMAAFLLSSGTKGKRICLKNGEVMIHQPLGGVQGQATEIKIAAERIIKLKKKLFFDYDVKTLEYVMINYKVSLDIAKMYLDNLYYLKFVFHLF